MWQYTNKLLLSLSVVVLFAASVYASSFNVNNIYINKNGELILNGSEKWVQNDFLESGYEFYKDKEIYISEGVLSKSEKDYDVVMMFKKNPILYFEIRNGVIESGVLVSNKVPIILEPELTEFRIGMSIAEITKKFTDFDIRSAEGKGVYAIFGKLDNLSFGSDCGFFSEELNEKQKKLTRNQLLKACKVNSVIFLGNEGVVWGLGVSRPGVRNDLGE